MDPTVNELLEAFRRAVNESERAARISEIRKHFEARAMPARDPDAEAVEAAVGVLDTDPAQAKHILREHFGPRPLLHELVAAAAREPDPVIWRDSTHQWVDAVLSVGEVAILASPGGLGKSTLSLELALAAVTARTGQDYEAACGLRVHAGPVVWVSYEDSVGRIGARIQRMSPKSFPRRIHVCPDPEPLFVGNNWTVAHPGTNWHNLWTSIRALGASLVVIDPASAALEGVNLNDSGPVRAFMRALAKEATAAECGVLMVAHDTKSSRNQANAGEDPGAGAVAGSATWFDAARSVLYLSRRGDGARVLSCLKANHGRTGWTVTLRERRDTSGRFVDSKPRTKSRHGHHRADLGRTVQVCLRAGAR